MARYAIVVARFYEDLAERLEHGARRVFEAEPQALARSGEGKRDSGAAAAEAVRALAEIRERLETPDARASVDRFRADH